mgnify:CR=1 FL=1
MRDFVYYAPTKVFFGRGSENRIGEILSGNGYRKIALHYGMDSAESSGLLGRVRNILETSGIGYIEIGGVQPNPKYDHAISGAEMCIREKADAILAIGGGSVIDSAKLMAAASVCESGMDPWKFFTKEVTPKAALPLGVVLTIASAGSEMSSSCVITNEKLGLKRGFNSDFNRPVFAVMDPELTFTVSPFQTACGIVDILMHTIERYFQPEREAQLTDSLAEALMRNVIKAGRKAVEDPLDYDARATLMWGSSLSHNGLTGAGKLEFLQLHQLEHELSAAYDEVAHAAGLSALFKGWAMYVYKSGVSRFAHFAVNVWGTDDTGSPEETAVRGIDECVSWFRDILRMPVSLTDLGLDGSRIEEMSVKCSNHGKRTLPGVMELSETDILTIFTNSLV